MNQGHGARAYSLRWLLMVFVTALMVSVLVAGTYLSASRFTQYLAHHLQVQTRDAAVALGVSLSTVETDGEAQRIIDAMFDSGAYRSIELRGPNGKTRHRRGRGSADEGVPEWFRVWARLPAPQGRAAVVAGWEPSGEVIVRGDPGSALTNLWQSFLTDLVWVGAILLLSLWVLWRVTARLLKPLGRVEGQALSLEAGDFTVRTPEPEVRELIPVVRAMNRMAEELSQTFSRQVRIIDELQRQVSQDPVTGLNNRQTFEQHLRTLLYSREESARGVLAIFRLQGFSAFNRNKGRPAGNRLLSDCSDIVRSFEVRHAGVISGRGHGAEIALFLPHAGTADGDQWLLELVHEMSERYSAHAAPGVGVVQVGATVADPALQPGEILARADTGLQQAESGDEPVVVWGQALPVIPSDTMDWRAALDEALAGNGLALVWQPCYSQRGYPVMDQVLARLAIKGEWMNAAHFIPFLERYSLTPTLDRRVLEHTLERMKQHPKHVFSVALGQATLADDEFLHWLGLRLEQAGSLASNLWLAFPERVVQALPSAVDTLEDYAKQTGVRLMVDQFGTGGISFDYLARIRVQGVRIGQHYVRDIHQREDARFFLESMVPVIQQQGMQVFVSGVEVADEWEIVDSMSVDGVTGFHLSRPQDRPSVECG